MNDCVLLQLILSRKNRLKLISIVVICALRVQLQRAFIRVAECLEHDVSSRRVNIPTAHQWSHFHQTGVQAAFITASKWPLIIYVRWGITTSARVEAFSASTGIIVKSLGRHLFHTFHSRPRWEMQTALLWIYQANIRNFSNS